MKRILVNIAVIALFFATDAYSRSSPVSVQASIDRQQAYIGDVLKYRITVEADSSIGIDSIIIGKTLGDFEVLRDNQSISIEGGIARRVLEYDIASYETGQFSIPSQTVRFHLPDGGTAEASTDSLPVMIMSVASGDSLADIRGLKSPIKIGYRFPWLYVIIAAVLLIIAAVILWRILRKKKELEAESEPVDTRPPWIIAEENLRKLRETDLIEREEYKAFYLQLTEIVRRYLEPRFGVDAIDRTTWELRQELSSIGLSEERYSVLFQLFDSADLVKFAKSIPTQEIVDTDFQRAWSFVKGTRGSEWKEVSTT